MTSTIAFSLHRFGKLTLLALLIPGMLLIAGCGGDSGDSDDAGAPAATGTPGDSAQATDEGGTGVKGTVKFDGPAPERTVLETEGDPKCFAMHASDPLLADTTIVSEDGGVQFAFVYVKNPPEGDYPVPTTAAVIDQIGCRYVPHVLGVQTGQELSVQNSDETLHNIRGIARNNRPFNNAQPKGSKPRIKKFDSPEQAIRFKCDIHPWMSAYVFAVAHPFFSTTDADGNFRIADLPAGEYTVVVWHEKFGEQEATVTVADGAMTDTTVTFKP